MPSTAMASRHSRARWCASSALVSGCRYISRQAVVVKNAAPDLPLRFAKMIWRCRRFDVVCGGIDANWKGTTTIRRAIFCLWYPLRMKLTCRKEKCMFMMKTLRGAPRFEGPLFLIFPPPGSGPSRSSGANRDGRSHSLIDACYARRGDGRCRSTTSGTPTTRIRGKSPTPV